MKKIKILLPIFLANILLCSNVAKGIAVIDSLDFSLTGSPKLDCEILGNIELERDPSWSDEVFYIHMVEQYEVNASDGLYTNIEAYRTYVDEEIKNSWNTFNSTIYREYAQIYHNDYNSNFSYYDDYNDELKDDYYRAYMLSALGLGPYGFGEIDTYDVIANYCTTGHAPITTTFGDYGYSGYMKLGDREVSIDDEDLLILNNGYAFHEDGFGDLKVELARIDDLTIKAKYTLKNLTGESTDFGVAFYTDVEFGDNDDAAISKTDHSFTITQDSSWYDSTFGAQFNIQLDPIATTTYVGYYYNARDHRWENSEKDYYTAADSVDTGLAYSWQGQIDNNETKVFSATYTMNLAETFNNYFYYLIDNYSEPDTIGSVNGGALWLPYLGLPTNVGNHREWNTKKDGTGISYQPDTTIISDKSHTNYYEKEVPNTVVPSINSNEVHTEYNIVITDEMKEKYKPITTNTLSNFEMRLSLYSLDKETITEMIEEEFLPESLIEGLGKDYDLDSAFAITDLEKSYIDQNGNQQEEQFDEDEFPITIRIKLTDDQVKNKTGFKIVTIVYDPETDEYVTEKEIPVRFDKNTNEIFFEIDSVDDFRFYALASTEIAPEIPSTGFNTIVKAITSGSTETFILLPISAVALSLTSGYIHCRRKHTRE